MIKLKEIKDKYGDYLIDEDKLKELLIKPKPKTVWDLKIDDIYYFINSNGGVYSCRWVADEEDLSRREIGNVFLTKEKAQFEQERRRCETIMLKYGRRTFKYEDDNYFIRLDYDCKQVHVDSWSLNQFQGIIYFDTEELARKAKNEIGEERLKKYIFRVEE